MMKRKGKILILAMLTLLMGMLFAFLAGASGGSGVLTVVYPDGTEYTFAEGEAVTEPAVPADFPMIQEGKAYKYTVTGAAWEYSSPLPAVVGAADLGKTVTASVAGECGNAQVYYTSLEKTQAGTVLVYHTKNDLNTFLSTSNTGDRGDGTNTGASSYTELRKETSRTDIKLYADVTYSSVTINWYVSSNRFLGGPVYFDLNGHTLTNTQTSWINACGMELYIFSSRPDAHWYQTKSASILRVNDDIMFHIGDDGSGKYTDNLSVHAKALFHDVYGRGAYVLGGRYYQTGVTSRGGMIDIKRRMHALENAKIFVPAGQAPLTDVTTADTQASPVEKGTTAIKNCTFYAPSETPILYSTMDATLRFENCNFVNVRMDTAAGTGAVMSYAAGNYTNLPPRKNLGKTGESIYPVKVTDPRTVSLTDADGASIHTSLAYETQAVAGGLTVSYGEESMLRLIGEEAGWKHAEELVFENGVPYKKIAETHTVLIDGEEITNATVTEAMAGKSAEGSFSVTYAPALFSVTVRDEILCFVDEATAAEDLAACLGALESGAAVKLYSDLTLSPLTVAAKRISDGAGAESANAVLDLNGHSLTFRGSGVALRVLMPNFSLISSAPGASVHAEEHALFATAADDYKWIDGAAFGAGTAEYAAHTEISPITPEGFLSICAEGEEIAFTVARVNADLHGKGAAILGGAFCQSEQSLAPYFLLLSRADAAVSALSRVENATFLLNNAATAPMLYNAESGVTFKNCRFLSKADAYHPLFADLARAPSAPVFEGCDFYGILPVIRLGDRTVTFTDCSFGFFGERPTEDLDASAAVARFADGTEKTVSAFGISFVLDAVLAYEPYEAVDILYPDGTKVTVSVGEAFPNYAMADTKTEDRRLYKLVGEGWTYFLAGAPLTADTVPPEAAGKCLLAEGYEYRKVYYTTLERLASGDVLVYHLKDDLAQYISMENLGDRGDGTNVGASSYTVLRLASTKSVNITLYEDIRCGEFLANWEDPDNIIGGRPVYLDLNGFTINITHSNFVDVLGVQLYIYSSVSGACWDQPNATYMFRPNDRGTLYLGNSSETAGYADNITFRGKALFAEVYGNGAYIYGGHYRQTEKTAVFVELSRRVKAMSNASFYLAEGTTALFGHTLKVNSSPVLSGSKTIESCYFHAPASAYLLYATEEGAAMVFADCTFEGIVEKTENKVLMLVYPDGTEQQLLLGEKLSLLDPAIAYMGADGNLYHLAERRWRIFDENGTEITESFLAINVAMLGKTYTAEADHTYERVYYTVTVGDTVIYNTDEDAGLSLASYLSAMDPNATVTLYSDLSLSPVRVTGRMGASQALITVASYALDLNGYTLSFTESGGVCFDVRVANFFLYSSAEGGRILAEDHALFTTSAKEYMTEEGKTVTVQGCITVGSSLRTPDIMGKNLSVLCRRLNLPSAGGEILVLGGSYTQSERGVTDPFIAISGANAMTVKEASFLIRSAFGAIELATVSSVSFENCVLVSLQSEAVALFKPASLPEAGRFVFRLCDFYNFTPELSLGSVSVTYADACFGFSAQAPATDLDSGIGEAYFAATQSKTVTVLGRLYVLSYAIEQRVLEGCTVVYPDGSTQVFTVGSVLVPFTNAESFVGEDGCLYRRSDAGWSFLYGSQVLTDLTVNEAMIGASVSATGYDRVYYTVEENGVMIYHTNAATAAASLRAYLSAMNPGGATVTLWSDLTIASKVFVKGRRVEDGSILKSSTYYLDINGYTLSFSGTSVAMIFQAATIYLYSSREGGEILAESNVLFYTDNEDYKWIDGKDYSNSKTGLYATSTDIAPIQIYSVLYIGEKIVGSTAYGDNLTVRCKQVNQDMYGTAAHFLGGTFVQSESSTVSYFFLLSRVKYGNSHVKTVSNTTFVLSNASTALLFYNSGIAIDFADCRFISADGAASLLYASSVYTKAPSFTRCSFYDITPTLRINDIAADFKECLFGFSGSVPVGDIEENADTVVQYSPVEEITLTANGAAYTLTHLMVESEAGFVNVLYPDGSMISLPVGSTITLPAQNGGSYSVGGVLYADLGAGWSFTVDGTALSSMTVDATMIGKTVVAAGFGRVYFTLTVGDTVTYYTNADTYAADLLSCLAELELNSRITLYHDVSVSSRIVVKAKRYESLSIMTAAQYHLDLNGHTLTSTLTSSFAMDVFCPNFYLYSSVEGGRIVAERAALFRSNDEKYKWINGAAYPSGSTEFSGSTASVIQPQGILLLGEDAIGARRYGENLTVVCAKLNTDLYGGGLYILGGTLVQSESSTEEYFLLASRLSTRYSHVKAVENATFVLRNRHTAAIYYNASASVTFKNCRFLCIAGMEARLFSGAVASFTTSPIFEGCRFYDILPEAARTKAVVYTDCRFGFTGPVPEVNGMYIAHSAEILFSNFEGREFATDCVIVSDLSEVATVHFGEGFTEYWMLGTLPWCNPARMDTVLFGEGGTAVALIGASVNDRGIRTVTEEMLGTAVLVEVSYRSTLPVAFTYTDTHGDLFYQTMSASATAEEIGELFYEAFNECDGAYEIRLHADLTLTKGMGFGPLGAIDSTTEHLSLKYGSVTLDLNGFTLTASADCAGINGSNSNSTNYKKPAWGVFTFEASTQNTFTLTSSRPGARLENLSGCSLFVIGEQSTATVVIDGENLTVHSLGAIAFAYEIGTTASLTVSGGSYYYTGSASPFICVGDMHIEDAEIYMTGAPIAAFGAHYYNRYSTLTVENTQVYAKNQTALFAFFDSAHKKVNASGTYNRTAAFADCVFIGVTLTDVHEGLSSVTHDGTAAQSEEELLALLGAQPENTVLALLERTVDGVAYRLVAYLPEDRVGVVDWGYGLPTEIWRRGETATRRSATVFGTFGYTFLPTEVDGAAVVGNARLAAMRPGTMQMSLTLQGQIGVNIFLSEKLGATAITVAGITYELSELKAENGYYRFSAPVASNMADRGVSIVLHAFGYSHEMQISIEKYASAILSSDAYANAHDITYAMVAHIEAQTGADFATCPVPDGYFARTANAYASQNAGNTILKGITFRLEGTIALAVLGAEGARVNLVLSTGRSEHAVIENGTAIFDTIYINEFYGDMQIKTSKDGKTETYVYNLLNYLYYQTDPVLIEKVTSLYNYTYFAHMYVDAVSGQIRDENGDHICDICEKSTSAHSDANGDSRCDLCDALLPWSVGLLFAENTDGTYTLTGLGSCEDTQLVIPDTYLGKRVTAIGAGALQGAAVTSVTIPEGVLRIEASAFANCASLKTLVLAQSVTDIAENAFLGADALTEVFYRGRAAMWRNIFLAEGNAPLEAATVYFYSELRPETDGYYWYESEGERVILCKDLDRDHFCDDCGQRLTEHADPSRDHLCDRCEEQISVCTDTDGDHLCDVCLRILSDCADDDRDHLCDICAMRLSEHVNADGNHFCDFCGDRVTACYDSDNDHVCNLCGDRASDCADTDRDHACDLCEKVLSGCTDDDRDHFCDHCIGRLSACTDADKNHLCDACDLAISVHADADGNHLCDLCGAEMTDCLDTDGDHFCDDCGSIITVCIDADGDHICDICGEPLPCRDLNGDHLCEVCGRRAEACEDMDGDHACDLCGEAISACLDEDRDHLCDLCEKALSAHLDTDGDHLCDICAERIGECADADADHLCDGCGITLSSCRDGGAQLCALCGRLLASEGLSYRQNADGTYTVIGIGDCTDAYIYIPKYYNGREVTAIGGAAFAAEHGIIGVSVPDSVKRIGIAAFAACTSLRELVIGNGTERIGAWAFALCDRLVRAELGNGVDTVGMGAFYACTSLSELSLGESVRVISLGAFYDCVRLESLVLPESVERVGIFAFAGCDRIETVTLPERAIAYGYGAFHGCHALSRIYYTGAADILEQSDVKEKNQPLLLAPRYFFSESVPAAGQGRYWYYGENGAIAYITLCSAHADANRNRVCDFCGAAVACEHALDAEGYCLWCSYFICTVHDDYEVDGFCDRCGAGLHCEAHKDESGDHRCDLCDAFFACLSHEDTDGDRICEVCLGTTEASGFPWESETITVELSGHSGEGVLSSRVISFMAGSAIVADPLTAESILLRNEEATAATGVTPVYRYVSDHYAEHGWSMRYNAIQVRQAAGIYSDVYCDFAYDMIAASLLGCFENLKTESSKNYFDFVRNQSYAETVGDRGGYMYSYMQSLAFDEDRMYLLASDYFIDAVRAFYCMPVNAAMLEAIGEKDILGLGRENTVADLIAAVKDGAWTYELLMRYSAAVADGEGFGLVLTGDEVSTAGLLYTSAVSLFNESRGVYSAPKENDALYTFARALERLSAQDGTYLAQSRSEANRIFSEGKALFGGVSLLGALEGNAYTSLADGVLILPVPVHAAGVRYETRIHDYGRIGAISAKTDRFSACSAFLNYQSTHSEQVLASYFANDLRLALEDGSAALAAANAEMLAYMRERVGGGRDQLLEIAISAFCQNRYAVSAEGEQSLGALRWQTILAAECYDSSYVRSYYRMLHAEKDRLLRMIYLNGATSLPR